ncbi:hypothetical protein [Cognatishimia sp.]|uniref:hypothetical protein n=1 Tax=Cognatishimia sp. TaxID=2211648 RepID=UPI00351232CA|nr:hypothetical protein [Cognatishimia sp.]
MDLRKFRGPAFAKLFKHKHVIKRVKERYDIDITEELLDSYVEDMEAGNTLGVFIKYSHDGKRRPVYRYIIEGRKVYLVYDKKVSMFCTCLTKDMVDS